MEKQSAYNKKMDNALDYCVKLLSSGATIEECLRLYPNIRKELRELLLVVVSTKRAYPDYPELRPSKLYFKTGRDNFLTAIEGGMPAIEHELFKPRATHSSTPFNLRELFNRYLAVGVAVVMVFVALGGLLYASSSSLPGSPLYGLKRVVEEAELTMTFDNEGKDRLRREFLKRRTDEANLLAKLSSAKTAVLSYQISRDDTNGSTKAGAKNNSDSPKLDGLKGNDAVANSGKTNLNTNHKAHSSRSSKKGKKRVLRVAATSAINSTPVPSTFSVGNISTSSDYVCNESTVTVSVIGATRNPFDVELYAGSTKIAVIAKQVSVSNYVFTWNGKDAEGNLIKDGEYKIKISSQGQVAPAEQPMIISSLPKIGLNSPVDGATVKSGDLEFKWDDIGDANYSLRIVSIDTDGKSITKDNASNSFRPTGDILMMLLGDNKAVKKWKWRVVATTNAGKMAISDFQTVGIDGAP